MTTATVTAVVSNTSSATMNTWIEEICNALFTTCGATQTTDTGQVWSPNTATGTLPGAANTSAGYVIGKFNDTLQSTCPVFFRLDFGTGAAVADPQVWITVGTSSNGSGTIGGTVMTKSACLYGGVIASTSTLYTSFYMYNATYGALMMGFKQGGATAADVYTCIGGFYLFRGSASTGAANSDAVTLWANNQPNGSGTITASDTFFQSISYGNSAVYPTTLGAGNIPFFGPIADQPVTANNSEAIIWPTLYATPIPTISAIAGLVNNNDVPPGVTFTTTILGSANVTMLNMGGFLGSTAVGGRSVNGIVQTESSGLASGTTSASWGLAVLWQ